MYGQYGIYSSCVYSKYNHWDLPHYATMDVLQMLLSGLIELNVHSMSLDIVLLVHNYAILA